jgi:hypothetical protein
LLTADATHAAKCVPGVSVQPRHLDGWLSLNFNFTRSPPHKMEGLDAHDSHFRK